MDDTAHTVTLTFNSREFQRLSLAAFRRGKHKVESFVKDVVDNAVDLEVPRPTRARVKDNG